MRQLRIDVTTWIGGTLTRRVILVKGIVSFTFLAWVIHPALATPAALLGNFIWLWVNPENEAEKVRKLVKEVLDERGGKEEA